VEILKEVIDFQFDDILWLQLA